MLPLNKYYNEYNLSTIVFQICQCYIQSCKKNISRSTYCTAHDAQKLNSFNQYNLIKQPASPDEAKGF